MANSSLFSSLTSRVPPANAQNEAGGAAYQLTPKHALAQLAATGCFNGTYYADAQTQLDTLRSLLAQVDDHAFVARLAIYSRARAFLKDMPAALVAALAARDTTLFHRVFDRVIDNGRMLRTLLQIIRSGRFGKRSLSSALQRAFQRWLNAASPEQLLAASIGANPSLRDVLRLARPTPRDNARRALFGWLTAKDPARWTPATEADLPEQVQWLTAFRAASSEDEQVAICDRLRARWDLLADTARGPRVWTAIARGMGPQALRMNLNTLSRHAVLDDHEMVQYVAGRLADAAEIRQSRQMPYQYLAAWLNADSKLPADIIKALERAAELACGNVPQLSGPVLVGLDVSGSMRSPVTGHRGGGTTRMRCIDVAALVAAALLRRNPGTLVVPFDTQAFEPAFGPSASILSVAEQLARYGGGGTDCSRPLAHATDNHRQRQFAAVVLVSDNESWVYGGRAFASARGATGVMAEWERFVQNQRRLAGESAAPKLICINLQPYATTQAPERSDVLNVGGFTDAVFDVVANFVAGNPDGFLGEVHATEL